MLSNQSLTRSVRIRDLFLLRGISGYWQESCAVWKATKWALTYPIALYRRFCISEAKLRQFLSGATGPICISQKVLLLRSIRDLRIGSECSEADLIGWQTLYLTLE
jgi:hypothetical protein